MSITGEEVNLVKHLKKYVYPKIKQLNECKRTTDIYGNKYSLVVDILHYTNKLKIEIEHVVRKYNIAVKNFK